MISMIIHTYYNFMKKYKNSHHPFGNICGAASMGERGQIVIPKEARDLLKAKNGHQFIVFEHEGFLILIPEKMMTKMMQGITQALRRK